MTANISLVDNSAVCRSGEHSVGSYNSLAQSLIKSENTLTSERLSSSTNAQKVLAERVALAGLQVLEKVQQVTRVVIRLGSSNEAVDCHRSIRSLVQLPAHTIYGDSGNGRSGAGDWSSSSEGSEPDHDLVLV